MVRVRVRVSFGVSVMVKISVRVLVMVMVMVSKLLGSYYGQDSFSAIVRFRVTLWLGLRL